MGEERLKTKMKKTIRQKKKRKSKKKYADNNCQIKYTKSRVSHGEANRTPKERGDERETQTNPSRERREINTALRRRF